MTQEVKWYIVLFIWFLCSLAMPLGYLGAVYYAERHYGIEVLKLEEEKIIHERNELIFEYAKSKMLNAKDYQSQFEFQLAETARRQSVAAIGQATLRLELAELWMRILKLGNKE